MHLCCLCVPAPACVPECAVAIACVCLSAPLPTPECALYPHLTKPPSAPPVLQVRPSAQVILSSSSIPPAPVNRSSPHLLQQHISQSTCSQASHDTGDQHRASLSCSSAGMSDEADQTDDILQAHFEHAGARFRAEVHQAGSGFAAVPHPDQNVGQAVARQGMAQATGLRQPALPEQQCGSSRVNGYYGTLQHMMMPHGGGGGPAARVDGAAAPAAAGPEAWTASPPRVCAHHPSFLLH